MNRKALGRGLGALLSSDRTIDLGSEPSDVELDSIVPGPMQPRTHFDEASLQSLADSIRSHGIESSQPNSADLLRRNVYGAASVPARSSPVQRLTARSRGQSFGQRTEELPAPDPALFDS